MRRLSDASAVDALDDCAMRAVVQQRLIELSEYEQPLDELAEFWLLDGSDTVATLEAQTGRPVMAGWPSPDGSFQPGWDVLVSHPSCFEMVFVLDDSGYGAVFWIPKSSADPDLLALCRKHAVEA
ncbi:hypothetical protein [Comamonas thiooxydans]|uniref:Uncharacterized protein n=1 Tax=Comamonas thiooxydans TaxID=363952 RepID=A0A0E3CAS0_9BURK|nr:hypothetical protein [Comamonas thiooxydans]KGH03575.1 hypothetical protein P608_25035 [Comamonas thiooxydans]KGH17463.1 hypothetical protein P607_16945 [Comamonas thiooxydans]KGH18886.1 hypothetical protein P606_24150 [Comamonas thiooxydans]